ncbi:Hypothetical predicted protein [Octopus vulgaris]|uniref:Uncharacterized protein n=1 Tax=Octopus vulgaris TaxID=6645 RepID=A0AA36EVB9_OCTVU|nr:Hypothetical predicted protein [Octopus vulgaris]
MPLACLLYANSIRILLARFSTRTAYDYACALTSKYFVQLNRLSVFSLIKLTKSKIPSKQDDLTSFHKELKKSL